MKNSILSVLLLLTTTFCVNATTITVCASGCDHTTIAAAISAASAGDVIEIQDAVHTAVNVTIDKNLTIQGQGTTTATILQGHASQATAAGPVFAATSVDVTFQNLTIRHGNNAAGSGGVAAPSGATSPNFTFINCLLTLNNASTAGVAYAQGGNISMTDCVVSNNSASVLAGAIYNDGTGNYTRCTFNGNSALLEGGAIYSNGGSLSMENSTVYNNTVNLPGGKGAGVSSISSSNFITNCTFSGNTVTAAGAGVAIALSSTNTTTLTNNIIANSNGGSDLDLQNVIAVFTNTNNLVESCTGACPGGGFAFTSDPNLGALTNCGSGGLSVLPLQSPSDAIDGGTATGTPAADQCGTARSGATDIGAAEFSAGGAAIPTMGEWTLIIFGLIILSLATVYVMHWNRRISVSINSTK